MASILFRPHCVNCKWICRGIPLPSLSLEIFVSLNHNGQLSIKWIIKRRIDWLMCPNVIWTLKNLNQVHFNQNAKLLFNEMRPNMATMFQPQYIGEINVDTFTGKKMLENRCVKYNCLPRWSVKDSRIWLFLDEIDLKYVQQLRFRQTFSRDDCKGS